MSVDFDLGELLDIADEGRLEEYVLRSPDAAANALALLLDVVEPAEELSAGVKWMDGGKGPLTPRREAVDAALAALESAQGAERPEPGEGA